MMNYYASEVLAFQRHRALLSEADRRRRTQYRQHTQSTEKLTMSWTKLLLTSVRRIGLRQA